MRTPKNVAFGYDIGKISAGCLVCVCICIFVLRILLYVFVVSEYILFTYLLTYLLAVQALVMIQKIRDAFSELLEEVPWMDEETRIVAREKVSLL